MSADDIKISVVIPAYNEEKGIRKVIDGLKNLPIVDEIIVVNDGSTDSTKKVSAESGAKVISHEKNSGYGASLKTGIINSKNNIVALIDGDAQHSPHDIMSMSEHITEYDMKYFALRMHTVIINPSTKEIIITVYHVEGMVVV